MSVLRTFIYEEWPAYDQYGDSIENMTNCLHIATAGLLGDPLLHIGIEDMVVGNAYPVNEAEINLTLDQAKLVLEQIKKFVDHHTSKVIGALR